MFTSGIVATLPPLLQRLHMSSGIASNLMSLISECGDAPHMHIQKDKRSGIGYHMEKCVFIGYPDVVIVAILFALDL